jgi:hypothetical protein
MANISPIPIESRMVDLPGGDQPPGAVASTWFEYFMEGRDRINASPHAIQVLFDSTSNPTLVSVAASIAATNIPLPSLSRGLYRVSYYARIMQAASTSSSLTVTLGWVDATVACSFSGSALTGNTTATSQSGTQMIRCDEETNVTYATTYASSGGTAMQYRLDLLVEQIPQDV